MNTIVCRGHQRREAVRRHTQLNGLDYLEVGADQKTLTVYFLGKAPVSLEAENIVIEGGRRIQSVPVRKVVIHRGQLAELDDFMEVFSDGSTDFSAYTLKVVARDEQGRPRPHPSFDPRYDRVEFSFRVDCPSPLDCKREMTCPPRRFDEPEINYLSKDYASFRRMILDRLAVLMPEWRERHVPDVGVTLVELLAYAADHLSYHQDAVATEAYLDTARLRVSVRRHVRLADYALHEGCNARTWVCVETNAPVTLDPSDVFFITRLENAPPLLEEPALKQSPAGGLTIFEPMTQGQIKLHPGNHQISFHTWGDLECCLPRGTRTATLLGRWAGADEAGEPPPCDPPEAKPQAVRGKTGAPRGQVAQAPQPTGGPELHLYPGDVLIFEETLDPGTGRTADADPNHRHPVRLTRVEAVRDPLRPELDLTQITWADEDALPFPLCLSAMGPPPCEILEDVSVARGNLILVDHGLSVEEDLGSVLIKQTVQRCDCTGEVEDALIIPRPFNPSLKKTPLTFSSPQAFNPPASQTLLQDPRRAIPQITLTATAPNGETTPYAVRRDLLESGSADPHYVVEIQDDGSARLRFGDGQCGRRPAAATVFETRYRVGNGPAGNVGADTITHLVTRKQSQSGVLSVRNPLPARGGAAPEPVAEAKLLAPHAFRGRLERAVTADDYVAIVMREFGSEVQRAAAWLLWNGSWREVHVAVDPRGADDADPALLQKIARTLRRYRRIGHNLVVRPARRVALDVALLVCVLDGYLRGHVQAALLEVFGNRAFGDGRLGFFHPDALSFGDGIYLSRLVAAAQRVTGVESVRVSRLQRLFEAAAGEIENGVLPLAPFEIARLDNDPSFPENGKLQLDMRGGR